MRRTKLQRRLRKRIISEATKLLTMVALIASISSFFWRLFPIIKSLDQAGEITPPGYSRTLGLMITGFIGLFAAALAWSLLSAS